MRERMKRVKGRGRGSRDELTTRVEPKQVSDLLRPLLAGLPARTVSDRATRPPPRVVWVDGGDEVLVHIDSLEARVVDGALLISLDLESVETGRSPIVVAFGLGAPGDPAGLVATTHELPRGDAAVVGRWGRAVQDAVWAALLAAAQGHISHSGAAVRGITVDGHAVLLHAGDELALGKRPA